MQGDFRLGDWLVEPALGRASRDGQAVHLRAKVVDLLVCLARRPGDVISKDELLAEVWKSEFVTESALTRVITELRQAFGDDADHPRIIETIPKRGYRLIAPVVRISDIAQPPEASHVASATRADRGARIGWTRTALVVGVCLALGVPAAWLATKQRTAAPILTERDSVLLADFANHTNDPAFDRVLGAALAIQLAQSPFLYFVPEDGVRETLRQMRQPPETALTPTIAREVCEREQAKVMVAGSITSLGRRYVVSLDAINCRTGESVGRALEEAGDKEHVLAALGAAASAVRLQLGESLASIQRFDVPVERVTTSSLEALRAWRLGRDELLRGAGHERSAIRFLTQAVALEPEFGMAYQALAAVHNNIGERRAALENLRRAWDLRDRVTEKDKLAIEALRAMIEMGDFERGIETYRLLLRLYPRERGYNNNLTLMYKAIGLHDEALVAARENLAGSRKSALAYLQLGRAYLCLGRFDEAQQVFEEARSKGLENPDMLAELYEIAFHRRNVAAMEQYIARATGHPLERRLTAIRVQSLAALGQWRASEQLSDRIIQAHPEVQFNETVNDAIRETVNVALRSALAGKSGDRWLRSVNASVPRIVDSDAHDVLAVASVALALTGDGAVALRLRDMLAQQSPSSTNARRKWMPTIAAATAIRNGDFAAAITSLADMGPIEFGRAIRGISRHAVFVPTYLRGQAYLASEQPRAAAVEFKKILDRHALGLTSPILPLSRLGLARAYAKAGDFAASLQTYDEVLAQWKDADPDYVPLVEARREYSELRKIDKVRRTSGR